MSHFQKVMVYILTFYDKMNDREPQRVCDRNFIKKRARQEGGYGKRKAEHGGDRAGV